MATSPQGTRPVRRQATVLRRQSGQVGEELEVLLESRETVLSGQGSTDTVITKSQAFHDCGHSVDTPVAGICLCGKTSCEACHGSCLACNRPLCPECSRENRDAQRICQACLERSRRRGWAKVALRILIAPFVSFEREERS